MAQRLTIGQLATAANVPISTVRFYERRHLLLPASRSPHGYRQYGQHAVDQLRFIRSTQASGFSLEDIARLLTLRNGDGEACEDVQRIIEERLAGVRQELKQLRRVERVLDRSLEACRSCSPTAGCQTLDELGQTKSDQKTPSKQCAGSRRGCRR